MQNSRSFLISVTGWVDCPLSEEGEEEAEKGGVLLRAGGYTFDKAYTSTLKRAIKTLWIALEELDLMYIPIVNKWQLNERHYGRSSGIVACFSVVGRVLFDVDTHWFARSSHIATTCSLIFSPQVPCKALINKKRWMPMEKNR